MRRKPQIGEVFLIPLGDGRSVVGQVVEKYGKDGYYLAAFDAVVASGESPPDLEKLTSATVTLLCLSLDAKLFRGDWPTIGSSPVVVGNLLPAYKVSVSDPWNVRIEDFSGKRSRAASVEEERRFPFRRVNAPIRLEKAVQALYGLREWEEDWDGLRPDPDTTSRRAFADGGDSQSQLLL